MSKSNPVPTGKVPNRSEEIEIVQEALPKPTELHTADDSVEEASHPFDHEFVWDPPEDAKVCIKHVPQRDVHRIIGALRNSDVIVTGSAYSTSPSHMVSGDREYLTRLDVSYRVPNSPPDSE